MPYSVDTARILAEPLVDAFFQETEGEWHSQRRYYTLKSGETQTVVSRLSICYLPADSPELLDLAALHELGQNSSSGKMHPSVPLICGAKVQWKSDYVDGPRKSLEGATVFGAKGTTLYRDRGFATAKPVTAQFEFSDSRTMTLKTAYQDSSFEEEIKLVGQRYRTRQTIIFRAKEEVMIGQYLETRI